jgi:hypothetical protein
VPHGVFVSYSHVDHEIAEGTAEAASFPPFEARAQAAAGRKEGRFTFVIHPPAAQRVTLEARLVDAAGRQSRPYRFSFEARKGAGGHFQIDTPHFKVKVP